MKLLNVDTLEEARRKVIRAMEGSPIRVEEKELLTAQGYVLAEDVCARENVPLFRRSTVDGYAAVSYTHLDVYKRQSQRLYRLQDDGFPL